MERGREEPTTEDQFQLLVADGTELIKLAYPVMDDTVVDSVGRHA